MDALLGALGHTVVHMFTKVPFLRNLVQSTLPQPGDGPPAALLSTAPWKVTLHGWTAEEGKEGKVKLGKRCEVRRRRAVRMCTRMLAHVVWYFPAGEPQGSARNVAVHA